MRDTSSAAYQDILQSGLLGKRQKQAFAVVAKVGPGTVSEMLKACREEGIDINQFCGERSFHKRLPELRDLGIIKEYGKRRCRVSGHEAITWDVSGCVPVKVVKAKRLSRKDLEKRLDEAALWIYGKTTPGEARPEWAIALAKEVLSQSQVV
jgi:hypothetical protein